MNIYRTLLTQKFTADQVLAKFGYELLAGNTTQCPFHNEGVPSFHVYKDHATCYGACDTSYSTDFLARRLLQKTNNEASYQDAYIHMLQGNVAAPRITQDNSAEYKGPVPLSQVMYWHNHLEEQHYQQLATERLLTRHTIDTHRLGYSAKREGISIPYWRGFPGASEVDIVQFRMYAKWCQCKYLGLAGHNRESIINAFLLQIPQPYVIVLFGSFDPLLAAQDGIIAVGTNGATRFTKRLERLRELFKRQDNVIVVPDNSPGELENAKVFAEAINGRVKTFRMDDGQGCDYIQFRHTHSAKDFMQQIVHLWPKTLIKDDVDRLYANLLSEKHDPYTGDISPQDIATALALKHSTQEGWSLVKRMLYTVTTTSQLNHVLGYAPLVLNRAK
jgi:DNA primase